MNKSVFVVSKSPFLYCVIILADNGRDLLHESVEHFEEKKRKVFTWSFPCALSHDNSECSNFILACWSIAESLKLHGRFLSLAAWLISSSVGKWLKYSSGPFRSQRSNDGTLVMEKLISTLDERIQWRKVKKKKRFVRSGNISRVKKVIFSDRLRGKMIVRKQCDIFNGLEYPSMSRRGIFNFGCSMMDLLFNDQNSRRTFYL